MSTKTLIKTDKEILNAEPVELFNEGWESFCNHINWGKSSLTGEDIGWMNDVSILMKKANAK